MLGTSEALYLIFGQLLSFKECLLRAAETLTQRSHKNGHDTPATLWERMNTIASFGFAR